MISRISMQATMRRGSQTDIRLGLKVLKGKFEEASAIYEELKSSGEREVVYWVWTASPRYSLDPLYYLNNEERVGSVARLPPQDPRGWTAYGFSKNNRIVVEHQYLADLQGRRYETFYSETEECIFGYHFHHDASLGLINCAALRFLGHTPIQYQKWAVRGWVSCNFVALDGRIRSFNEVFKQGDEPQKRISGEIRYKDNGQLEVWTKWPGARTLELTFRGISPAENPFLRQ